eukprot:Phypoly_transcript_05192.p1 GENE.Phypoly_transcript_05192~~Phypoly_transcript_05192.p1  ORF type:complete len:553 (+),score=94.81 Phypoly_transcript_05192:104-1762(+)
MGAGGSKKEDHVLPNLYDEKRRTHVAKEIVETERSYVKNLQILCEAFLQPLKDSAASTNPILSTNEIKDIFGIIEVIVNFHATLLGELDERMKRWDASMCMGDIFAKNNAFFKMISTYVNGYNTALMTYCHCKSKNKAFSQFLEKTAATTSTLLDLQSYLIMPVQRLPRYVLLLTELVKYSNSKHPGYQSLSESLEAVKKVADFVNDEKRRAESALKMLQIQESLVGKRARPILEPTRRYYGEGTFTWLNSQHKEPRPLQYYLFSDCILLATPEKGFFQSTPDKLKVKILEPLVSVDIQENQSEQGQKKSKFDIKSSRKVFAVKCEPQVDVDEWIEVFYWIRSGCGPRYEKVNAEVQKRNLSQSGTIEQRLMKVSSESMNIRNSSISTSTAKSTTGAPLSLSTSHTHPPTSPLSPSFPPISGPNGPAGNVSTQPSTPKTKPTNTKTPPNAPATKQLEEKRKSFELAKPAVSKPPRPLGPPPPLKEKVPSHTALTDSNGPPLASGIWEGLERQTSFTASFSAFFGMKSNSPQTFTAAPPPTSPHIPSKPPTKK